MNDRFFVNNVSLGVYAKIVQEESYRDAKVETTKTLLPEMLGRQAEPFDLQFTTPDGEDVDGAILVMVSNNAYVIGASPDNAQRRHLDRGQLGVFAVTTSTGSEAARLFAAIRARPAHPQRSSGRSSPRPSSKCGRARAPRSPASTAKRSRCPRRCASGSIRVGSPCWYPRGTSRPPRNAERGDVRIGDLFAVAAGREPQGFR